MTDKQIIINGVDVSGCPYYIDSDGSCSSHDCECIKCIHNVCFYKDYKAKEQECEDLKAKIEYVFSDVSPNFNYFCDVCVAKDKCNQNCCFEQIKELIYEAE